MNLPRCHIIIPARLASTRLPEKLLRRVGGKSVLQHTFEAAAGATLAEGISIAVDDSRVAREVESFGGRWVMTDPACASGTDRIAEVARGMPGVEVFVNVQGDEPEIDPATIDLVARTLIEDASAEMATIGTPIRDLEKLNSPSCVKIVMAGLVPQRSGFSGQGRAVYFSRAAVPFTRDQAPQESLAAEPPIFWHHLGLYAYRRDFLEWFAAEPPSLL